MITVIAVCYSSNRGNRAAVVTVESAAHTIVVVAEVAVCCRISSSHSGELL